MSWALEFKSSWGDSNSQPSVRTSVLGDLSSEPQGSILKDTAGEDRSISISLPCLSLTFLVYRTNTRCQFTQLSTTDWCSVLCDTLYLPHAWSRGSPGVLYIPLTSVLGHLQPTFYFSNIGAPVATPAPVVSNGTSRVKWMETPPGHTRAHTRIHTRTCTHTNIITESNLKVEFCWYRNLPIEK